MDSYYRELEQMTLSQLISELERERDALSELLADEPYDDRGRQIGETRDNIEVIERLIREKS